MHSTRKRICCLDWQSTSKLKYKHHDDDKAVDVFIQLWLGVDTILNLDCVSPTTATRLVKVSALFSVAGHVEMLGGYPFVYLVKVATQVHRYTGTQVENTFSKKVFAVLGLSHICPITCQRDNLLLLYCLTRQSWQIRFG